MSTTTNEIKSSKGENAAISLLDKYARINSGIESTRKQTQKVNNEIENLKNQIHTLKYTHRIELLKQSECTKKEIESFKKKDVTFLTIELQNIKVQNEQLKVMNKHYETQIINKKNFIKRRRLHFIQKCKEFRNIWFKQIKCKEGRSIQSDIFTYLKSDSISTKPQDSSCQKNIDYENECDIFDLQNFPIDINHKDPLTISKLIRSIKTIDFEIDEAKQNALTSLKNKSHAQLRHKNTLTDLEKANNRTQKRRKRLQLQRSQLENVRNDVSMIENEIEKIKNDIKEAANMAQAYAKDACRRKRNTKNNLRQTYNSSQYYQNNNDAVSNKKILNSYSKTSEPRSISNPYYTPSNSSKDHSIPTVSFTFNVDQDSSAPSSRINTNTTVTPSPSSAFNKDAPQNHILLSTKKNLLKNKKEHKQQICDTQMRTSPLNIKNITAPSSTFAYDKKETTMNDNKINYISKFNKQPKQDSSSHYNKNYDHTDTNYANNQVNKSSLLQKHQFPHRVGQIRVNKQFSTPLEISYDENRQQENIEEILHDEDDELLSFVAFDKK